MTASVDRGGSNRFAPVAIQVAASFLMIFIRDIVKASRCIKTGISFLSNFLKDKESETFDTFLRCYCTVVILVRHSCTVVLLGQFSGKLFNYFTLLSRVSR
jgi:hypothetical protein